MLTREEFLAKGKRRIETLPVPGVGEVRARSLTEPEKAIYESVWYTDKGKFIRDEFFGRRKARLLMMTMLNADDTRMFADDEEAVVADLGPNMVDPTYDVIYEFCQFGKNEKIQEQATKNSDSPPASSS